MSLSLTLLSGFRTFVSVKALLQTGSSGRFRWPRSRSEILGGLALAACLLLPTTAVVADGLTADILVDLERVRQAALSPGGEEIVFQLQVPRAEGDEPGSSYNELWLLASGGGEPRQLTSRPVSSTAPAWSPDGKTIGFLSQREVDHEETQLYGLPRAGGEARPLTRHDTGVLAFAWSPDGERIAFLARDGKSDDEKEAEKAGRDWIVVDEDFKHRRLWIHELGTGESRLAFDEDLSVWDVGWSPDGETLVFRASDTPRVDDNMMHSRLYRLGLEERRPEVIAPTEGKLEDFEVSPDGRQIAFLGATALNDPLAQSIFAAPLAGGIARNLMEGYEGSAIDFAWRDDDRVLVLILERQRTALREIDLASGEIGPDLWGKDSIAGSFDLHRESGRVVAPAHAPAHPAEVYALRLGDRGPERLTRHNPVLDDVRLARQEVVSWSGAGDWEIEGVLTYPLDYREGHLYPLVLQLHGGPEGIDLDGWSSGAVYPIQVLAAQGWFVFQPNYRGSAGRGVAFATANHDDLGGAEFEDILTGIDHLVDKGLVDPERVGTGGFSYGGYFSAWGATRHTERFRAAVFGAGLSNWISFTGTTDIPYEMSLVHWNSWWFDEPELHWQRSPLAHIRQADTPVLIVTGTEDTRVHPQQAMELYTALRIQGVPTRFVKYPRAPHGLPERAHQLDYIGRVVAWFEEHL